MATYEANGNPYLFDFAVEEDVHKRFKNAEARLFQLHRYKKNGINGVAQFKREVIDVILRERKLFETRLQNIGGSKCFTRECMGRLQENCERGYARKSYELDIATEFILNSVGATLEEEAIILALVEGKPIPQSAPMAKVVHDAKGKEDVPTAETV